MTQRDRKVSFAPAKVQHQNTVVPTPAILENPITAKERKVAEETRLSLAKQKSKEILVNQASHSLHQTAQQMHGDMEETIDEMDSRQTQSKLSEGSKEVLQAYSDGLLERVGGFDYKLIERLGEAYEKQVTKEVDTDAVSEYIEQDLSLRDYIKGKIRVEK